MDKGREDVKAAQDYKRSQLWKSVFRHKLDETPRTRALAVLTNVFLHLHPAKINRDAVRFNFTWGMGGISFYLFFVLTITGVFLMFYYHPTKGQAWNINYSPEAVELRQAGWVLRIPISSLTRRLPLWTER